MSSFGKNIVKLVGGGASAHALTILVSPILTRLFAPEAFGTAGLFASIVGVIGAAACLRYELALMLPESDEQAANLLAGALLSTLVISSLTALIVVFGRDILIGMFNCPDLANYVWLMPPMVALIGFHSATTYWNSRKQHFGVVALSRMTDSVGTNGFNVIAALCGYVMSGTLIFGTILGRLLSDLLLGFKTWFSLKQLIPHVTSLKEIISSLKRYKHFAQFGVWSGILLNLSLRLPVFFVAYFFTPKILGLFVLTQTVLRLPVSVFVRAVSQVFFQQATAIRDDQKELCNLVEQVFTFLVHFFMLPMILLSVLGKDIFTVFFGDTWSEAGLYAQMLSVSFLVQFISAPINSLFNVLERQKQGLLFDVMLTGVRSVALISGGLTGSILLTLVFYALGDIIGRGWKLQHILKVAGVRFKTVVQTIAKIFGQALPLLALIVSAKLLLSLDPMTSTIITCLLLLAHCIILAKKADKFPMSCGTGADNGDKNIFGL